MAGFDQRLKDSIRERDSHRCVRCGWYVAPGTGSVHHRRNRGAGGSRDPLTNHPSNLILTCGDALTGCHGWIGRFPRSACVVGLSLKSWQDPTTSPLRRLDGSWWQPGVVWEPAQAPEAVRT